MNDHQETELLSAYMDGALPAAQARDLKNHIEACAACQRELHELHSLKGTLQSLPRKTMPVELLVALRGSVERDLTPAWKIWISVPRILIPAAGLAAALLVAGLWIWQREPGDDVIPIESLLAAHSRYLEEGSLPPADLSADGFSAKLASYQSDVE